MLEQLILIRHGVTDWNQQGRAQGHTNVPLNEEGQKQARALAGRMAGWPIRALYSSDLERAARTARIVGEALGLEPVLDGAFRELNMGEYEGRKAAERPYGGGSFLAWVIANGAAPGGESYSDLRSRVAAGYARIADSHEGETVALVGHGGVLKTLILHLLGLDPALGDRISLRGNASLSVIDFSHGHPVLTLLNDTSHHEQA